MVFWIGSFTHLVCAACCVGRVVPTRRHCRPSGLGGTAWPSGISLAQQHGGLGQAGPSYRASLEPWGLWPPAAPSLTAAWDRPPYPFVRIELLMRPNERTLGSQNGPRVGEPDHSGPAEATWGGAPRFNMTANSEMSAGVMPWSRDAWPRVAGRNCWSLNWASLFSPWMDV